MEKNQFSKNEALSKNKNDSNNKVNNIGSLDNISVFSSNNNDIEKNHKNLANLNIKEIEETNKNEHNEKTNLLNIKENFNNQIISENDNYQDYVSDRKKLIQNNNNESNYSTFNNTNNKERSIEASIEINENTTTFDLYKGLIYMFLSCIFKSLFTIFSKFSMKNKKELSSFQLLTYRTYFMMWISIIVCYASPGKIFSEKLAKMEKIIPIILRTLLAIVSLSLLIYTIKFIHISDVYSVYYIYPGFVILFSMFFLREKIGFFDVCCLIASFIGAILIVKPDFIFDENTVITLNKSKPPTVPHNSCLFTLVIIAALSKSIEDVIIRNIGKDVNFLIFPIIYSLMGIILFPIPMFIFDTNYPSFSIFDVIIIFLVALFSFLYMSFMALGFQNESAGRVSMVNYLQVALMYISDLCMFDKKLQLLDLVGTCLIFGFNFSNGLFKAYKRMNSLEKVKKKINKK